MKVIRSIDFQIPVKTISELNGRDHWAVKNARKNQQQMAAMVSMRNALKGRKIHLPCSVKLTRIGPRRLDSDRLASAFQAMRAQIARELNVNDGDTSTVTWEYSQMPISINKWGVKVSIVSV